MSFAVTRDGTPVDSLRLRLRTLVDTLINKYGSSGSQAIPPDSMSVSLAGQAVKLKVLLRRVELRREKGALRPVYYFADILYAIGKP